MARQKFRLAHGGMVMIETSEVSAFGVDGTGAFIDAGYNRFHVKLEEPAKGADADKAEADSAFLEELEAAIDNESEDNGRKAGKGR